MDQFSLVYRGFHPSNYTRTLLETTLRELHDESPFGSNLVATFTRKDGAIKGIVKIYSSAGNFFAMSSSPKIRDVTHKITHQLRRQIDKWKSSRFSHDSILGKNLSA